MYEYMHEQYIFTFSSKNCYMLTKVSKSLSESKIARKSKINCLSRILPHFSISNKYSSYISGAFLQHCSLIL